MKILATIIGLIVLVLFGSAQAQCVLNATPATVTINCGESVDLVALATGNVPLLVTDFDNGTAGPGWASTGGAAFAEPCGPNPTGTPYYWASTATGTPQLSTVGFPMDCGGTITFDMAYATQGGPAPCEGPDLANEGVTLEYSIDGGLTWIQIDYWDPLGGNDPTLTSWNTYSYTIPPGAIGPNTMFQWIQYNSSGACCDNWGIDNVVIAPGLCGAYWYDWDNIPGNNDPITQTVSPMSTTQYAVLCTDGVDICYDTVEVIVVPLVAEAITSLDSIQCGNCADLDITIINSSAGSVLDDFDPIEDITMWSDIQSGTAGVECGAMTGNALHFDGVGTDRFATTIPINATVCGNIDFCLFMGNTSSGGAPCENADAGENVVLEYSIDGGATWVNINTYDHSLWDANNSWQCFSEIIPVAAQTLNTMFRWDQIAFSACNGCDNWSLDDVSIACAPPAFDIVWTPATGLSDPLIQMPQACPVIPTQYVGTITDPASGCSASDSVMIDVVCGCYFLDFTGIVSDCENGNTFSVSGDFEYIEHPGTGTIEIEATNASGTYTTTINGPFSNNTLYNYNISGIISDGSPITVTIYFSDELSCSATINDVSPVLPEVTGISGGAVYCFGGIMDDILVDVTGNGPWSIDYTLDGVPQNAVGAVSPINLGNAVGVYELTDVNDAGCTNTAVGTETIISQTLPEVVSVTGGGTYCPGDVISDILVEVSGTGPWVLDYELDGVAMVANSAINPINLGSGIGTYVVTGITDAGCSNTAAGSQTIIVNPLPNVFAGNDFINCEGNTIVLSGSGAQTYVWDNGVVNNVGFIPQSTLTYTVTGTDANGCVNTDDIVVTYEALPIVSFEADVTSGCEPLEVVFTNTTPGDIVDCVWEFEGGVSQNICGPVTHLFQGGGTYDVTLTTTSINGCTNSITYTDYIYVEDNPIASFSASSTTMLSLDTEVFFTNNTTGAVNYLWNFGDSTAVSTVTHPTHIFPSDQTFGYEVVLIAYSPIGCTDTTKLIIQINQELIFYIPNSFTPDDDEFNQMFQPVFTAGFDPYDFDLFIFNRWGEIIFESHDASMGWDGTYHGKVVQAGTYTWKIEFKTEFTDERKSYTGHINVIK